MNLPYRPRHSHKENVQPQNSTARFAPLFKAPNQSGTDHSRTTYDPDSSQDTQIPHKSFDLSTILNSKNYLQSVQRKPLTNKKNTSSESFRLTPHQQDDQHTPTEQPARKPVKALKAEIVFPERYPSKSIKNELSDISQLMPKRSSSTKDRSSGLSSRAEISRKGKELRDSTYSSQARSTEKKKREENRDSLYESIAVDTQLSDSASQHKDLVQRNKQIEETLRFEVLRGEEQRAYIEVLKETIADHEGKLKDSAAQSMRRRQNVRDDVNKSDKKNWREGRADVYTEVPDLHVDMPEAGALEGRVSKHIEIFQEKLKEISSEKEMVAEHLNRYKEVNEKLMMEINSLRQALHSSQEEVMRIRDGNSGLVEQVEWYKTRSVPQEDYQMLMKDNAELKKELKKTKDGYEELRMLSMEIENQRKMACKRLEDGLETKQKYDAEKQNYSWKINKLTEELGQKNEYCLDLENKLSAEQELSQEEQRKYDLLEENYGVLRMTLNETEAELEKATKAGKEKEEAGKNEKKELNRLKDDYINLEKNLIILQQDMIKERENKQREIDLKEKDLQRVYKELEEVTTSKEKVSHDNDVLKTEKVALMERFDALMYSSKESRDDVDELNRKYRERERAIKALKEQVNVMEKENGLLKSLGESSRQKSVVVDRLKDENSRMEERNEALNRRVQELKGNVEAVSVEYREAVQRTSEVAGTLDRMEMKLQEIIENYLPQDGVDLDTEEQLEANDHQEAEDDMGIRCQRIFQLIQIVKLKAEGLNDRYTQAKMDIVREMERRGKVEDDFGASSLLRKENSILKERLENLVGELRDVNNDREILRERNEELYHKFSHVSTHVQRLKEEVREAKSKDNVGSQSVRLEDDRSMLKDAMIRRLNTFMFNIDAKELIEELMRIEARILAEERDKDRARHRSSFASVSTNDFTEKKEASFTEFQATQSLRGEYDDKEETIEMSRAKRAKLEKELIELESQERQRYDALYLLQKQNFELKSEIGRLMNELEVNYSEYGNTKIDCYTNKMNDRLNFTNGFDLTITDMDPKAHKDRSISDFHMEYSMEKITGENDEDPYYS